MMPCHPFAIWYNDNRIDMPDIGQQHVPLKISFDIEIHRSCYPVSNLLWTARVMSIEQLETPTFYLCNY